MSATLHAIRNAATATVEVDSLTFRVRKVRASDVASVGFAALTMLNPANLPPEDADEAEDDLNAKLRRMSPKQLGELTEMQTAIVCAGVMAVSADSGESWDDVDLVMESKREDPTKGRLCVHSLPPGCVETCFSEIMNLSTDREEAALKLRTFLEAGELEDVNPSRHSRAKIRKTSKRITGA
jgi:hypothetical protein